MAKFTIIKRESVSKYDSEKAKAFISASAHWSDLAIDEVEKARIHAEYAKECINEAAKLLGFKNTDELNAYIAIHGKL